MQLIKAGRYDLDEVSMGRIYQHIISSDKTKSWGIVTAHRGELTSAENKRRNKELENELRNLGLGFAEIDGMWRECKDKEIDYSDCPDDKKVPTQEKSFFVPNISKKDIHKLGNKYEQDSVIYGGDDTDSNAHLIFKNGSEDSIGKFTANKISQGYSKMKGDRVFTFLGKGDSGEKYKKPEPAADTTSQKMVSNPTQLKSLLPKGIANKMVKNPDTGRMIKVKSALKYDKNSPVYKSTMAMIKNTKK